MKKNKKKIKVTSYMGVRNDAQCNDCDYNWSEKNLSEIRSHVKKTGHRVVRTYGSSIYYELE